MIVDKDYKKLSVKKYRSDNASNHSKITTKYIKSLIE
jgi:hypothetical protein